MSKNKNINSLEQLPHERQIPSVNDLKKGNLRRGIVFILAMTTFIGGTSWAYLAFMKTTKQTAEEPSAELQSKASFARTFTLNTPRPPDELAQPMQNVNATRLPAPQPLAGPSTTQELDKSDAELMISNTVTQATTVAKDPVTVTSMTEDRSSHQGALSGLLNATQTPMQLAGQLGNRNFILAKGSVIECGLQTRLDSTVAGMTSCVVSSNIYSDNGKVLLIERGSTVSGEYQANMQQGMRRIFVLWNRIKTPNGITIDLNSPGVDALGASGFPGEVDNHFWQRFGGALLLSLIDDVAGAVIASQTQSSGTQINLNSSTVAAQTMATEVLKNTINIPPTLYKNQGERVGIYIARDLNFESVYAIQPNE